MPSSSGPPHIPEQWEVWHVNWPHEDGFIKPRPGLILSTSKQARLTGQVYVAKISGVIHQVPFRIGISVQDPEFAETGLTKSSHIYIAQTQILELTGLLRRRGSIGPFTAALVEAQVPLALGMKLK